MSLGWTSFSCSLPASDNMGVPILVPPRKGVGIGGGADGAEGCEIAFWPVICVPSSRPAEIWWEKLLFMAGMTFIFEGTPVMAPRRYMADSKLPVKSRAPVRKRFPTDADWKLKDEVGRRRFTISRLMVLKRERMSLRKLLAMTFAKILASSEAPKTILSVSLGRAMENSSGSDAPG